MSEFEVIDFLRTMLDGMASAQEQMAHNQFSCGDHPRVTEIERIATEALKGMLSP